MKVSFDFKVNSVIEILILSDFLVYFSFGLLAPIFAIYISGNIEGGDLQVVGAATAIYWIVRSVTSAPLSRYMDRTDGERDEFAFMFLGLLVATFVPLFYIAANQPWHIYVLQGLLAICFTMAVPAWRILFTNHLDKGKTGFEWSLEDVAFGMSTAISAYVGSVVAERFGFPTLFVSMSAVCFMGALMLWPVRREIKTRREVLRLKKSRTIKEKAPLVRAGK